MAKGRKTGGRTAGTPNKSTATVAALIDGIAGAEGVNCFKKLGEIAFGAHDNVQARLIALRTLIEYRHGKSPDSFKPPEGTVGSLIISWK